MLFHCRLAGTRPEVARNIVPLSAVGRPIRPTPCVADQCRSSDVSSAASRHSPSGRMSGRHKQALAADVVSQPLTTCWQTAATSAKAVPEL